MTEDPQAVMQKLYVEQQMLESNIGMLKQHIELIQASLTSYRAGHSVLDALAEKAVDEMMLMNVGGGIYVEAKLVDPQKVIRSIGSDVRIDQTTGEAKSQIGETVSSLETRLEQSQQEYGNMANRISQITQQLQQLTAMIQGQPQQPPEE
ncbi:MAG: prefoldin subunit alpha [Candidatus Thorarchaeota archaeon]